MDDGIFFIDTQGEARNLLEQEQQAGPEETGAISQDDVTSMLEARVLHFARDAPLDCLLAFPPALSSADRLLVEVLAESLHLQHHTAGRGKRQRITIYKSAVGAGSSQRSRGKKIDRKKPHSSSNHQKEEDELGQPWWVSPEPASDDADNDSMLPVQAQHRAGSRHSLRGRSRPAVSAPAESAPALPLDTSHRGHQLLVRLGWTPGDGLGAAKGGALEPLAAYLPTQTTRQGLGASATCD